MSHPVSVLFVSKLLGLLLLFCTAASAMAQEEKALYKLGLIVSGAKDNHLDQEVLDRTMEAFVHSRRFTMVERSQMKEVFSEKDFQLFLARDSQRLLDVMGLDLLGFVSYEVETASSNGKSPKLFTITVRLVDVRTGWILGALTSERSDSRVPSSTPREAARLLFQNIREAFPPFGYVVKVAGKEVVVDLGSEAGLKDGDVLEVVREEEQIIHPITGRPLPARLLTMGELKVVDISSELSTCWLKWSEAILPGDQVRLREKLSAFHRWLEKEQDPFENMAN